MANDQARKSQRPKLTPEQQARIEAIRAKNRTPEARAEQAQSREALGRERRETGTIKTTGDGTTMGELVAFPRFVMALRRERERLGLSLADVAERAKIDKGALSRLENGQQLNPTVNTLARYAQALGKSLAWGLIEKTGKRIAEETAPSKASLDKDQDVLRRLLQRRDSEKKPRQNET